LIGSRVLSGVGGLVVRFVTVLLDSRSNFKPASQQIAVNRRRWQVALASAREVLPIKNQDLGAKADTHFSGLPAKIAFRAAQTLWNTPLKNLTFFRFVASRIILSVQNT
jgi:hypothetical protein